MSSETLSSEYDEKIEKLEVDILEDDRSVESSDFESDSEGEPESDDEEVEDELDEKDSREEESLDEEYESNLDSESDSDSDEDENSHSEAEVENENESLEEADGLELLRLAKLRMAEQKDVDYTTLPFTTEIKKEEFFNDDIDQVDAVELEEEAEETEDETLEESDDEFCAESVPKTPAKPIMQKAPARPSTRPKMNDEDAPLRRTASRSPRRNLDSSGGVTFQMQEGDNDSAIKRRERDENAELWALLRHSQRRLTETQSLVENIEKTKAELNYDDSDEETNDNENDDHAENISPAPVSNSTLEFQDEKKCEDEVERDFEKENQELFELLQKSKRRLDEAARKKAEEAERKATAEEAKRNPYKDLQNISDSIDDNGENDLTQKDLLIAMAVAEEAARSGNPYFVTPSKEDLRSRNVNSFQYLIKERKIIPVVSDSESSDDDDSVLEEQNRIRFAYKKLVAKWSEFKERAAEIDAKQQYQSALRTAEIMKKSSRMFFQNLSPKNKRLRNTSSWR